MKYAIPGYEDVTAEYLLGIFGNPIKHTLSPVIHDTLSDALGLSERYVPFCVEDEELSHCVKLAYDEGVLGLNITVPHKQHVMETLVDVDIAAKTIGAVNTLVRVEGGYKGYNTDMPGLAKALETEGIALKDETVIMLGAGGAARAVAYMCVSYGAKQVYIVNRTYAHAQAVFVVEAEAKDTVKQAVQTLQATISHEYQVSDPDVTLKIKECTEAVAQVMNRASGDAIIDALVLLPNGVQKMSDAMPELVQTSLNLGILTMKEEEVQMGFSVRSSVGSEKNLLALQIRTLCEHLGGQYTESGTYPAWEYKQESKLRDVMVAVYEELYGGKPKLDVIHAGVECGLFMDKMKDLDCVSYGPQMYDIHTPNERLHVDSVQRTWEYTLEILKRLK